MSRNQFIILPILAIWSCISGCSNINSWIATTVSPEYMSSTPAVRSAIRDQERSFAGALEFLRAGREQDARTLLEQVIEGPRRGGVTDEALFRLSLLCLRDESGKGAVRALELMEQLRTDFPNSIWTYQGGPLVGYLTSVRNLKDKQREVKTLKELNLSLSRDNREMRQSLERLKSIDLELEKKIKH